MTFKSNQAVLVAALVGLALLIAAGGMLVLVLPQRSQVGNLNHQVTAAEATLAAAHAPMRTSEKPHATDLFRLMEAMPDTDQMPAILTDLSRLAKASSVGIVSVHPSPRILLPLGYSALPLAVVVNGKYPAVTRFLRLLRQAVQVPNGKLHVTGRLFVANQIALSSANGRTVQASLNLDAFDYGAPPPQTATAGGNKTSGSSTTTTTGGSG